MPYTGNYDDAFWNQPASITSIDQDDPWSGVGNGAQALFPSGAPSAGASFQCDPFACGGSGDMVISWYVKRAAAGMTGDALFRVSNATESAIVQMSWNYTLMVPSRITSSGATGWDITEVADQTDDDWYRMYLPFDGANWLGDDITVLCRPYGDDLGGGHGITLHGIQLEPGSTPGPLILKL